MPVAKISRSRSGRRQRRMQLRKASDKVRMPQWVQVFKERAKIGTMHLGVFLAVRYRGEGRGLPPERRQTRGRTGVASKCFVAFGETTSMASRWGR